MRPHSAVLYSPRQRPTTPTPDQIAQSPCSSTWLKDALRAALRRDPVDAVHDAELLARVLGERCAAILDETLREATNGRR